VSERTAEHGSAGSARTSCSGVAPEVVLARAYLTRAAEPPAPALVRFVTRAGAGGAAERGCGVAKSCSWSLPRRARGAPSITPSP